MNKLKEQKNVFLNNLKNTKTKLIKQMINELKDNKKGLFYQRYAYYVTYKEIGNEHNTSYELFRLENEKIKQKVLKKYHLNGDLDEK